MNNESYEFIENEENVHWWFLSRKKILRQELLKHRKHFTNAIDIGCGTGNFIESISDICDNVKGLDCHSYSKKSLDILQGSADKIPVADKSNDLITMLDVMEHIKDVDVCYQEVRRALTDDGMFLITVPANNFLYSPHDKNHDHVKRYSKKVLLDELNRNGYDVIYCSHFNTFLFPIEAPIRLIEKIFNIQLTKGEIGVGKLNKILYKIFSSESKILKNHSLPFGLSLMAVAVKKVVLP